MNEIDPNQPDNSPANGDCRSAYCSADDLSNGLRHAADDHPCCKPTLLAAADAIDQMAEALDGLSQPLGRYDYTVAKLDEVVRKIAADALILSRTKCCADIDFTELHHE
jgi:hypothetical protein